MLEGICPNKDSIIFELGVGTGAITKFVQDIVLNEESYLGIEIDKSLVKSLKMKYPHLKIIRGNACNSFSLCKRIGFGKSRIYHFLFAICFDSE